jgi:hypothetical protein
MTKGLILIESLALELDPEFNLMQQIESVVGEMTVEEVKEKLSVDLPDLIENYSSLLTQLPALVHRWLAEREGGALQARSGAGSAAAGQRKGGTNHDEGYGVRHAGRRADGNRIRGLPRQDLLFLLESVPTDVRESAGKVRQVTEGARAGIISLSGRVAGPGP